MSDKAPVEIRSAQLVEVDYPARTIEVLAVPYDEWATVPVDGRMIEESFAPGAFAGVEVRARRRKMTVNLEHERKDWVGRVVGLYPDEPGGLRAELLIRKGVPFDQVLDDAADGMYAASVGFAPIDPPQWDARRTRRRITKAYLDHIALTTEPAFEGTDVLAVRSAPRVSTSQTPNLDRILADRALAEYRSR